mgnify:FL=1
MSTAVVGLCQMDLQFPSAASLKDKRRVLQSLVARLRNEYNVSVAEVGHQDAWQLSTVAVACASSSGAYARGLLEKVVQAVENDHREVVLLDYETELL